MAIHPRSFSARLALGSLLTCTLLSSPAIAQADVALPNPPQFPAANPMLPGQDTLGKFLFFEEQMSWDNTRSCGTCHVLEAGGADPGSWSQIHPGPDGLTGTGDDIRASTGVVRKDANGDYKDDGVFFPNVQVNGRAPNSPINAVYYLDLFWDGHAPHEYIDPQTGLMEIDDLGALETQAQAAWASATSMSHESMSWDDLTAKIALVRPMALATNLPQDMADFLATFPTYPDMFDAVYGDPAITSKRIMFACANYERTLISDETPLDAFLKGETPDLGPFEPGFKLFTETAFCSSCHVLPFTQDDDFHNIGVRPDAEDTGLFKVTGIEADKGRFKTPDLRNAKLRVPLFHNGGKDSIADVIDFYDVGGDFPGPNLDPDLLVLNLTAQEKADLIAFVEDGLLDPRVENGLFPFNRPTLRSELPSLNTEFGVASVNGAGDPPNVIAHVQANRGHVNWLLGISDATPNASAVLVFSFAADDGSLFPDPRFPIPMNIDVSAIMQILPVTTGGTGIATVKQPIPMNAALAGMKFYVQWFIRDTAAVATGGFYGSKGVEVTIL